MKKSQVFASAYFTILILLVSGAITGAVAYLLLMENFHQEKSFTVVSHIPQELYPVNKEGHIREREIFFGQVVFEHRRWYTPGKPDEIIGFTGFQTILLRICTLTGCLAGGIAAVIYLLVFLRPTLLNFTAKKSITNEVK